MNKARFVLLLAVTVFITGCTFPQVPWPWDGPITLPEPEPGDQPVPEDPDTGEHPEPDTGSSQFLWKPKAENDGKLVCITPARYRTKSSQSACKEYTVTKAAVVMVKDGEIIQREAKVSYFPAEWNNGNRMHHRFKKTGKKYGKGCWFALFVDPGNKVRYWEIKDGAKRLEVPDTKGKWW